MTELKQRRILKAFERGRYKCTKDGLVLSGCKARVGFRPLKLVKATNGYTKVMFYYEPKKFYYTAVHQLVWLYFRGTAPAGLEINHIDGIKDNNMLSNLELVTPSDNQRHAIKLGLKVPQVGESHGGAKLTEEEVLAIRGLRKPAKQISAKYGVSVALVSLIKNRHIWKHIA